MLTQPVAICVCTVFCSVLVNCSVPSQPRSLRILPDSHSDIIYRAHMSGILWIVIILYTAHLGRVTVESSRGLWRGEATEGARVQRGSLIQS